jgi:putative DNA primase/helicase
MSLDLPPLPPFSDFDPGSLVVVVGPRDNFSKRTVTVRCRGRVHADKFDTDENHRRAKFRAEVMNVFGIDDEGFHEWCEAQILDQSRLLDSKANVEIFKPIVTMLNTVAPQTVEWLWPNRIAIGKNNLVCGDPGLGKSLFALDVAARVSTGAGFPDAHHLEREPGGVVVLTMEDDAADTLVPRLLAHGADTSRIAHVQGIAEVDGDGKAIHGIDLTRDIDAVRAAAQQVPNCRLVIIDTIGDYLGKTDAHRNNEVRAVLNPLAALATECRLAILAIAHFRKGEGRAIHAAMGSLAFVGQARVAWAITRCQTNARRRLLTCIKNNLAVDNSGLAYSIEPHGEDGSPVLCWEAEPVRMNAEQAMAPPPRAKGRPPEVRDDAAGWLAQQLAQGPQPATQLLDDADGAGFNRRTVQRAFNQLGCKRSKAGLRDPWVWSLPEDDTDATDSQLCHPRHPRENTVNDSNRERHIYILPARVTERECLDGSVTFDASNAELADCNGHEEGASW